MKEEERLALAKEGHMRHYRHARDYGEMKNVGVQLGVEQMEALERIETNGWLSRSEHIRRAIDYYLAVHQELGT